MSLSTPSPPASAIFCADLSLAPSCVDVGCLADVGCVGRRCSTKGYKQDKTIKRGIKQGCPLMGAFFTEGDCQSVPGPGRDTGGVHEGVRTRVAFALGVWPLFRSRVREDLRALNRSMTTLHSPHTGGGASDMRSTCLGSTPGSRRSCRGLFARFAGKGWRVRSCARCGTPRQRTGRLAREIQRRMHCWTLEAAVGACCFMDFGRGGSP